MGGEDVARLGAHALTIRRREAQLSDAHVVERKPEAARPPDGPSRPISGAP